MPNLKFQWFTFDKLSADVLYQLLQLRAEVFVVEQDCVYQDLDGCDQSAHHLCVWDRNGLVGYVRAFPPDKKYPAMASFGRVVLRQGYRGSGLGAKMLNNTLEYLADLFPEAGIGISAQAGLQAYYESFGFCINSAPYDEDGIPHIEMIKESRV